MDRSASSLKALMNASNVVGEVNTPACIKLCNKTALLKKTKAIISVSDR